jgi:hypothetical protein
MTGPEVTQPDPDGGVEMTDGEWAAFRGVEVTAAMKAEDVDAALVEKASNALSMLRHGIPGEYSDHTRTEVRHALAAVVPEIQAQALREREGLRDEVEAFRDDLTALREGLMERIGRYTPSDADLLAYVDALKAQVDTQEPAGATQGGSGDSRASGGLDGAAASPLDEVRDMFFGKDAP